mgnify:CR=1 FL=1|tara:strand:+ start:191 stop:355 length:165 start_codon:yes stop_codon:yes gene_type:complete
MTRKKNRHISLRVTDEQKTDIRKMSGKRKMFMSQYIWFLVENDKEKINARRNND